MVYCYLYFSVPLNFANKNYQKNNFRFLIPINRIQINGFFIVFFLLQTVATTFMYALYIYAEKMQKGITEEKILKSLCEQRDGSRDFNQLTSSHIPDL